MGDDKCSDCGMLRDECGLAIAPCCDACYKSVGRSHTPTPPSVEPYTAEEARRAAGVILSGIDPVNDRRLAFTLRRYASALDVLDGVRAEVFALGTVQGRPTPMLRHEVLAILDRARNRMKGGGK